MFVAPVVKILVPCEVLRVIGPTVGTCRAPAKKMAPSEMTVHIVVPLLKLIRGDPFIQVETETHAPSRNGTKSSGNITLQSQIDPTSQTSF